MDRPYRDPLHKLNGSKYLTGKLCVEKGCSNPAGTSWSPYWCQPCNAVRLDRIDGNLNAILAAYEQQPAQAEPQEPTR